MLYCRYQDVTPSSSFSHCGNNCQQMQCNLVLDVSCFNIYLPIQIYPLSGIKCIYILYMWGNSVMKCKCVELSLWMKWICCWNRNKNPLTGQIKWMQPLCCCWYEYFILMPGTTSSQLWLCYHQDWPQSTVHRVQHWRASGLKICREKRARIWW